MTLSIVFMQHGVKNQSSNLLAHHISTKSTSTIILHFLYCLIAYLRFSVFVSFFCYKNKMTFLSGCHKIQLKPTQIFNSVYKTYHTHEKKKRMSRSNASIWIIWKWKNFFSPVNRIGSQSKRSEKWVQLFECLYGWVWPLLFLSCSRLHVFTD